MANVKIDRNRRLVRRLHASGMTDLDISLEIGVTRQAVSLWRKRNGLQRNSRKGRVYATWHHLAAALLDSGWSMDSVAERVNRRRATVQRAMRRMWK